MTMTPRQAALEAARLIDESADSVSELGRQSGWTRKGADYGHQCEGWRGAASLVRAFAATLPDEPAPAGGAENRAVSPLDKVLVDARYELTRWKMGAPPDQARLQLLIERLTEHSPYQGNIERNPERNSE